MTDKKVISILLIEDSLREWACMERAIKLSRTNEYKGLFSFELIKNEVNYKEAKSEDVRINLKNQINKTINSTSYNLIIFDFALQDSEGTYQIISRNLQTILSIEIANQNKKFFKDKNICVLFTSRLKELSYLESFNDLRSKNKKLIDKDWFYIQRTAPIFNTFAEQNGCPEYCRNTKRYDQENCSRDLCFLYTLSDIYTNYSEGEKI